MWTTLEGPDAELYWPPQLLALELLDIQRTFNGPLMRAAIEALLNDAFVSPMLAGQWNAAGPGLGQSGRPLTPQEAAMLIELSKSAEAGQLRKRSPAVPYRSQRRAGTPIGLLAGFTRVLDELNQRGYFAAAADSTSDDRLGNDQVEALLQRQLALHGLDLDLDDEDGLLDAIEAAHDIVARPRVRQQQHATAGAYFAGSHYTSEIARMLYREVINALLTRSGVRLRLADDGEDVGRLIEVQGSETERLMREVRESEPPTLSAIDHAIALFRARDADIDAKRSAIVALARLLEECRGLLEHELLTKDEDALFRIANEFDLRHGTNPDSRKKPQHDDYDEVFLDWIFHWYLATIDLVNKLVAKKGGAP